MVSVVFVELSPFRKCRKKLLGSISVRNVEAEIGSIVCEKIDVSRKIDGSGMTRFDKLAWTVTNPAFPCNLVFAIEGDALAQFQSQTSRYQPMERLEYAWRKELIQFQHTIFLDAFTFWGYHCCKDGRHTSLRLSFQLHCRRPYSTKSRRR